MIARDWLHVGTPPPVDCAAIIAAVASYTRRTTIEITGRSLLKRNAWPRQLAMWLCYTMLPGASLPTIGRAFDHRDHTTVMHAIRRAEERLGSRQPADVWGELARSSHERT